MTKPNTDNTSRDELGKLGKKWVKKYGISIDQAISMELDAADVYAHPTRDGWCCACDADIAFAMDYIKGEPEYHQHTKSMCETARLDELKQLWNSTQSDIVPEGAKANDMSEQLHKRIAELQSTIKTNRSI